MKPALALVPLAIYMIGLVGFALHGDPRLERERAAHETTRDQRDQSNYSTTSMCGITWPKNRDGWCAADDGLRALLGPGQ